MAKRNLFSSRQHSWTHRCAIIWRHRVFMHPGNKIVHFCHYKLPLSLLEKAHPILGYNSIQFLIMILNR